MTAPTITWPDMLRAYSEISLVRELVARAHRAHRPMTDDEQRAADDILRTLAGRLSAGRPLCPVWSAGRVPCQFGEGHSSPHSFEMLHDGQVAHV